MQGIKLYLAMILMAGITYLIRCIPLVFFRKKIQNPYIKAFLNFVPFAVLGAMIFPDVLFLGGSIRAALAGVITAFVMSYFGKGLLSVSLVSCVIVYIVNLLG